MNSRQIKFRGLDSKGKWHFGSYHYIKGDGGMRVREWGLYGNSSIRQQPVTFDSHFILTPRLPTDIGWDFTDTCSKIDVLSTSVGQYTGLKDKNGVEIYEGDIIKDSEEPFIVRFGECTFLDCRFQAWYLEHIPDTGFWKHEPIDLDDLSVFKVIGNIYEHPHLLNVQQ